MRSWFLSYTSQDFALTQALKAALQRKDPDAHIFFAPEKMRAGGFWKPQLTKEIEDSTAFVLLVGEKLGYWQVMEYYEALDRRAKEPNYPIILILSAKRPAPGLPFARQLHWVLTEEPASESTIGKLLHAASGAAEGPNELWRFTRPYRGLEAMTEANSDYFFGRDGKTVEVIDALASTPGKFPILFGNSGVGKSSLAQAGVLAALLRQGWSDRIQDAPLWPSTFHDSRRWCFLTLRPGTQPLQSLVALFLDTWQYAAASSERVKEEKGWIELLREGKAGLPDLLNATERRYTELAQTVPPAFFLYIDQGEELYVRAEQVERRRFSQTLAHGISDRRLRVLMSMRSDFLGELQTDELLFDVHRQINIPPLREIDLREVVSRPAELLSARFETDRLSATIAQRTAEESTKDVGALPLLSYLLDDMWTHMVDRGDGVLRLPEQAFELGGVLVRRANAFVTGHPNSEEKLRRIFTLKLATVREDGEPTRRRAPRSEFSDDEWPLVSELADHPNRLLIIATSDAGETYAEVAHEAIFRRWDMLRDWISAEREFLAWRTGLEVAHRAWQAMPEGSKNDALLMGAALTQAQSWVAKRSEDVFAVDREFIDQSTKRASKVRAWARAVTYAAIGIAVLAAAAGFWGIWQDRQSLRREAALMTSVAQRAIGEDNYDLAMRAALHGLPPHLRTSSSSVWSAENIRALWAPSWSEKELRALEAKLGGAAQGTLLELKLRGHSSDVRTAAFNPEGTRIVTASDDGTARVWNARTGQELVQLKIPTGQFRSAAFSPDGRIIATASTDKAARLWEATTGAQLLLFGRHEDEVWSAAFSPDGKRIVTASKDKTARIWDAATGAELLVLSGHGDWVLNALFSPDGSHILTTSSDRTARLWDANTGALIREFRGHTSAVRSAAFSPDATLIITASFDYTARIWEARSGKELILLKKGNNAVRGASFSPDGTRVVTTSDDGTATVWDTKQGRRLITLIGHSQPAVSAMFSADGEHIVTASEDRTARVWKANGTPEFLRLTDHQGPVLSAKVSPDGKRIATGSTDRTVRLWDANSGVPLARFEGHSDWIRSVSFNSDGSRLVTASKDQSVRVWDVQTGTLLRTIRHPAEMFAAAFDPSGKRIVTACADGIARVWDSETGAHILDLKGHTKPIWDVAFSPDARRIITASDDFTWRIWDAASGSELLQKAHDQEVKSASFSLDERRILTASWDHTTRVWDSTSGLELMRFLDNNGLAFDANFSPDGDRVVTSFGDGTAWVWDAHTGAKLIQLKGHERPVRSAAFSPDGRFIVTASEDRTVRLWHSEWLVNVRREQLARRVCSEKLVDEAQMFTRQDESEDENLSGLKGQNACALHQ